MKYEEVLYEDSLIKVFRSFDGKTVLKQFPFLTNEKRIEHEYNNSLMIKNLPFNKAKVIGRNEVHGKMGIIYEYIKGKKLKDLLIDDFYKETHSSYNEYSLQLSSLHKRLLNCKAPENAISYKKNLTRKVQRSEVHTKQEKREALDLIKSLPEGESLCHGSLVPNNVIISEGESYAIDFASITRGPIFFDIAKTYCCTVQNYRKKTLEENFSKEFRKDLKTFADLYLNDMGVSWSDIKDYHYLVNFSKTAHHGIR
jgi:thiamine kinase-like enzyme